MKKLLKTAYVATFPVLTGYLVLGFGFGIIMKASGFGLVLTLAMSLMIYAGSMQYAAISHCLRGDSALVRMEAQHPAEHHWGHRLLYGAGADGVLTGICALP